MKTTTLLGVGAVLAVIAGLLLWSMPPKEDVNLAAIDTFEECAAAGYPIMESYPEQCRTPDGRTFVRDISNETSGSIIANGCAVAGCSGQLCISAEEAAAGGGVSTCEYRAEYGCYKEASCEPQANGKCGWTQTPALQQCLANPPQEDGPSLEINGEVQAM